MEVFPIVIFESTGQTHRLLSPVIGVRETTAPLFSIYVSNGSDDSDHTVFGDSTATASLDYECRFKEKWNSRFPPQVGTWYVRFDKIKDEVFLRTTFTLDT